MDTVTDVNRIESLLNGQKRVLDMITQDMPLGETLDEICHLSPGSQNGHVRRSKTHRVFKVTCRISRESITHAPARGQLAPFDRIREVRTLPLIGGRMRTERNDLG